MLLKQDQLVYLLGNILSCDFGEIIVAGLCMCGSLVFVILDQNNNLCQAWVTQTVAK